MKTAFITGTNKGIGYALAKILGQHGVHVLLGVRNFSRGSQAVATLQAAGVRAVDLVQIDMAAPTAIETAIGQICAEYGDLDLLINNVGTSGREVANRELTVADLQATLQVNFLGVYQLTRGLLPVITENQGTIVNITMPTDANPIWNPLAYKSSKAALNVFTDSLAIDMKQGKLPVSVFGIHPGPTTTDLNDNADYPGFHQPDDVAAKILPYLENGSQHAGEFVEIYPQIRGGE